MTTALEGTTADSCAALKPPEVNRHGERRTWIVIAITAAMMVAELIAGWITNSLALTADGWHMGTHVGALGLTAVAYWYARTRAGEARFAFGTGKIYALAGYTSAGLLVAVALIMGVEAVQRLITPEAIDFREALPVAVIGLIVNLVSAKLLALGGHSGHGHEHGHSHEGHDHHGHAHEGHDHHRGHDHNLRAAYLHVVADAVTSLLAICSLLAGRWLGWGWLDPLVALVGAAVILNWGVGLLRECAHQLIDFGQSDELREKIRAALAAAADGTKVHDLHVWRVGPSTLVCMATVSAPRGELLPQYKQAVLRVAPIDHLTVEIREALRSA